MISNFGSVRVQFLSLISVLSSHLFQFSVSVDSVEFDKVYTGVIFSPYIKQRENHGNFPGNSTYTLDETKAMLEVVSERFSKIATYGYYIPDNYWPNYVRNDTYYKANGVIYTAEAAAFINKEANRKRFSVLVGFWVLPNVDQMVKEVLLALESAEKANNIFPGTVEGLVVYGNNLVSNLNETNIAIDYITRYRNKINALGLRIGIRLRECSSVATLPSTLVWAIKVALRKSDFVICENDPNNMDYSSTSFKNAAIELLKFRDDMKILNSKLEVMGQILGLKWNKKDLQTYWENVNSFAVENKFTMWLVEAIDNPWRGSDITANMGWWKLTDNSKVLEREGYIEKISDENGNVNPDKSNTLAYVGYIAAAVITLLLLAMIIWMRSRIKTAQEILTRDDVQEFLTGIPGDSNKVSVESAFKLPYDKSYDITKDDLKIYKNICLGSGQFGIVYKAVIKKKQGDLDVALKMAKDDCPISALKGFMSEIKILIYLGHHTNIVSMQGAYTDELLKGVIYIATELCSLGSLENYLKRNKAPKWSGDYVEGPIADTTIRKLDKTKLVDTSPKISLFDLVQWSHQIACGMQYIGSKHVVHADLATRNILLTSDKTAKITDFGLSRKLYDYAEYVKKEQGELLPWRWMAIESLERLEFSSKSDVWSYGITLWEIFSTDEVPYSGLSWNSQFIQSLKNGMRCKHPKFATTDIYNIMKHCWNQEPSGRPTFSDLEEYTAQILHTIGSEINDI